MLIEGAGCESPYAWFDQPSPVGSLASWRTFLQASTAASARPTLFLASAAAHRRPWWIHPLLDDKWRVIRLMSHPRATAAKRG
jgi:hypothetical protein